MILTQDSCTIGSGIVSCIPPKFQTLTECQDKILRIEDGDIDFKELIQITENYPLKFYNTWLSQKLEEFPGPVVLNFDYVGLITPSKHMTLPINLAYIRSHITCSNKLKLLIEYYTTLHIPIIITKKEMFIPHKKNPLVFLCKFPCHSCGNCIRMFFNTLWRINHKNYKNAEDLY